jgi:hypothetical protein
MENIQPVPERLTAVAGCHLRVRFLSDSGHSLPEVIPSPALVRPSFGEHDPMGPARRTNPTCRLGPSADERSRLYRSRIRPSGPQPFMAASALANFRPWCGDDVDLESHVIRVRRAWDRYAAFMEPKSRSGKRTVPIAGPLRAILIEYRLRIGRPHGLMFGRTSERPFDPATAAGRARRAWAATKQSAYPARVGPDDPRGL